MDERLNAALVDEVRIDDRVRNQVVGRVVQVAISVERGIAQEGINRFQQTGIATKRDSERLTDHCPAISFGRL